MPEKMPLVIAEIGTSHEGSVEKAKALVDLAKDSGADAVKFQWVYADEILHPKTGFVNLPTGKIPLYDRFKSLECPPSFYREMKEYAESLGLKFVCSPFGLRSLSELLELSPYAIKIASPELDHYPMLKALTDYRISQIQKGEEPIPVIISSGVSTLSDIEKALSILTGAWSGSATWSGGANSSCDVAARAFGSCAGTEGASSGCTYESKLKEGLTLLHCITSYPAPEDEYNVRLLETLAGVFGVPCGLSDHSLDAVLVPVLSVLCGAVAIEKHITLSRKTSGLDDPVALEGEQFALMVHAVSQTRTLLNRYGREKGREEIFKQLSESYPVERIERVLGSGVKALAKSERENYGRTNRSLHFMRDMKKGEVVSPSCVGVLRTEKVLTPGISPEYLDEVVGSVLSKDVEDGSGVQFSDFTMRA